MQLGDDVVQADTLELQRAVRLDVYVRGRVSGNAGAADLFLNHPQEQTAQRRATPSVTRTGTHKVVASLPRRRVAGEEHQDVDARFHGSNSACHRLLHRLSPRLTGLKHQADAPAAVLQHVGDSGSVSSAARGVVWAIHVAETDAQRQALGAAGRGSVGRGACAHDTKRSRERAGRVPASSTSARVRPFMGPDDAGAPAATPSGDGEPAGGAAQPGRDAPGEEETGTSPAWRVKVYRLSDLGTWDDQGTGYARVEYIQVCVCCGAR